MARRQLGHGRGGRMKIESDAVEVRSGRAPRPHARQPDRAPGRQPRLRELGGADEPLAGRGRGRGGPPAAARPRRPRRPARSTATPTSATCSSAPARARPPPGSPPARSRKAFLAALGVSVHSHVLRIGSVEAPDARRPRAGGLRRRRRDPGALPRPRGERGDGRGDQPPAQGEREPRRHLRGARLRARPRARLPRLLGGAARRPPGAGDGLDPVGQGRLRSARPGTSPGARARRPTTRSSTRRSAATTARPTTPAASRAG